MWVTNSSSRPASSSRAGRKLTRSPAGDSSAWRRVGPARSGPENMRSSVSSGGLDACAQDAWAKKEMESTISAARDGMMAADFKETITRLLSGGRRLKANPVLKHDLQRPFQSALSVESEANETLPDFGHAQRISRLGRRAGLRSGRARAHRPSVRARQQGHSKSRVAAVCTRH